MEKTSVPEGWQKVDREKVVIEKDGRLKILCDCKCGAPTWVKQGRVFKRIFLGKCPSCGRTVMARIRAVKVTSPEEKEEITESGIKDVDLLVSHLIDIAIREMDPVIYDAAQKLMELNEKHWSECWQIGVYSDTDEKAQRLVRATTMEPLTVDGVKDSAKAVKTIWTESDLDKLSPDDGTVRYYTD